MTRRLALAALSLLFFAAPALATEAPAVTPLSAEQAAELMDGETIRDVDSGVPVRAEVVALIQAPMHQLAEIIVDYDRASEWAPATPELGVSGRDGEAYLVTGVTALPWPIANRTWTMRAVFGEREVEGHSAWVDVFQYVEGSGNIDDSFGYWLLLPWPEDPSYTYVKYVVNADPGIALPDFVIRWATGNALPGLIEALSERHDEMY